MTPEEAIKILENKKEYSERITDNFLDHSSVEIKDANETIEMCDMAISALKEIQQYRAIGTVEEFKKLKLAENGTIWGVIDEYVAYKQIGTVEECREAREKQTPKKCYIDSCPDHTHYKCPSCGQIQMSTYAHGFPRLGRITKYCENCGQALVNENLEGMRND